MSYDVVLAPAFWDSVRAMRGDGDSYGEAVMDTLVELAAMPFHNPRLQTHDVGVGRNKRKVFSSDVGGRRSDRRMVWQVFNKTIVVLLYGTHAVQERAKRMRLGYDAHTKVVTLEEPAPDTGVERPYQQQREQVGTLFMAWDDRDLAGFGFGAQVVAVLRRLDTDDDLLALQEQMRPEDFERAYNLVAHGHPEGEQAAGDRGPEAEAVEPEVTEEDREIERHLGDTRAGGWFTRSEPEFVAEVLSRPIEDWMIFLHPDQRAVVSRRFEGPARVRGSAGTGKTVVGLHRAAWLAEQVREQEQERARRTGQARPVLFTTFIKSLPPVFESLYLRLPGTRAGEVEFVHVDRLAHQVCADAGDKQLTIPREINAAFGAAHTRVVTAGTPLGDAGFGPQYLRDEVTSVIKGRGIASLDTYLEIARTGRRAPLSRAQRTQAWDLMQAWDEEMATRGTVDFPDVVLRARDHARRLAEPRYHAAVVDEAQDLTLVGLQLVRALVNGPSPTDVTNGLLLLGDGAQRIYAGGFKLRQAGVEVRGRTTVLRTNYRNTGEIIGTALAVGGDQHVDDLGEEFRRGDEPADASRHGARPLLVEAVDLDGQLDAIAAQAAELATTDRVGIGDIGVLVPTNRLASQVEARLKDAGLAVQSLKSYDGRPRDALKVGTYHRGKGLEFKAVFLPGLSAGSFPRPPGEGQSAEEAAEARDLALSTLFVAMTRARDLLVVLYDGEPSDTVAACADRFERMRA